MEAVEILKREHRVIEKGLEVLQVICDRLEKGERVEEKSVESVLEFLQVFADQCHHGKEEGILFPALEARGIPREGGPIGVMLTEHEEGRALRQQMAEASKDLGRLENRQSLIDAARQYIQLLRNHIFKEDHVLFAMAESVLLKEDADRLVEAYQRHEREEMGEGVHELFHNRIHHLRKEFGLE